MRHSDIALLQHMLQYSIKSEELVGTTPLDAFLADDAQKMAAAYALQIVGEAASKVSPGKQAELPQIEWPAIIGLRHRIVHDYFGVNYETIGKSSKKRSPNWLAP